MDIYLAIKEFNTDEILRFFPIDLSYKLSYHTWTKLAFKLYLGNLCSPEFAN